jgi:hypothetical protein
MPQPAMKMLAWLLVLYLVDRVVISIESEILFGHGDSVGFGRIYGLAS